MKFSEINHYFHLLNKFGSTLDGNKYYPYCLSKEYAPMNNKKCISI